MLTGRQRPEIASSPPQRRTDVSVKFRARQRAGIRLSTQEPSLPSIKDRTFSGAETILSFSEEELGEFLEKNAADVSIDYNKTGKIES